MPGRDYKIGLDYFELSCLLDDNIKLIQAEFGLKGFAVIVKLYQKIFALNGYYCEWNDDILLLFMVENGLNGDSKNLISEIVAACIRRNIFSDEIFKKYGILTSEWVQNKYLKATSKRESVELKKEYLLVSVDKKRKNVVINSIYGGRNEISAGENEQSREEKSREEKINNRERFTPPTVEEVSRYCQERNNEVDAQMFVNFYESKGWMIGKNRMKDWKASVRTWERKNSKGTGSSVKVNRFNDFPQREYDFDRLERQMMNDFEKEAEKP